MKAPPVRACLFKNNCSNFPISQIGTLLLESLSLLGYFALFHPKNQAVLRWGKSPTILHKVNQFFRHLILYLKYQITESNSTLKTGLRFAFCFLQ